MASHLSIDGSKATPVGDIPADMFKVTLDIHFSLITKIRLKMDVFQAI